MASGVVNVHECDGTANRGDSFVPKFVRGIEVMGELVSRRDYSTQRAPLHRAPRDWRYGNAISVLGKVTTAPMLLISNEGASQFDNLDFEWF